MLYLLFVVLGVNIGCLYGNNINNNNIIHNVITCKNVIRNNTIRFLLSNKMKRMKQRMYIFNKILHRNANANVDKQYNNILARYYDSIYLYYTISDEDYQLLEYFISSCY